MTTNTPARVEPPEPPVGATSQLLADYDALWRLAQRAAKTTFVPAAFRNKPEDTVIAMGYGMELGLKPLHSLQSIYVVDGRPTCAAQMMRALIQSAGHLIVCREWRNDRVSIYGRRRDNGADQTVTWTLDDARTAKLLGKGNWGTYPRQMLAARATTELARFLFADVLAGIGYTAEELGAAAPYDAIDVAWQPATEGVDPDTGEILDTVEEEADDLVDADTRFADQPELDEGRPFE